MDTYSQRRTLFRVRRYGWTDMKWIRGRGNLVDFVFSAGKFRMNLYVLANSRELVRFVRARVPEALIDAPY